MKFNMFHMHEIYVKYEMHFNYFTFQQMSPSSSRNMEPLIAILGCIQPMAEILLFSGEGKKERKNKWVFSKALVSFLVRVVFPESFKHS